MCLVVTMAFSLIQPIMPRTAYAASTQQQINQALDKFALAATRIGADISNMSSMVGMCTRLGGFTTAVDGIFMILQMAGAFGEDPTMQMMNMLQQIINMMADVQTQLDNLESDVKTVYDKLVEMQTDQVIIDRNTTARDMASYWRTFNTSYIETMKKLFSQYNTKINRGINDWWEARFHDGVLVLVKTSADKQV